MYLNHLQNLKYYDKINKEIILNDFNNLRKELPKVFEKILDYTGGITLLQQSEVASPHVFVGA